MCYFQQIYKHTLKALLKIIQNIYIILNVILHAYCRGLKTKKRVQLDSNLQIFKNVQLVMHI